MSNCVCVCVAQIDPLGRPTVPAGSDHCFRTHVSVRTSVYTFQNIAKQNKYSPESNALAHRRTFNHVLYVSNVSRLARPDFFVLGAQIEKMFGLASLWLEVRTMSYCGSGRGDQWWQMCCHSWMFQFSNEPWRREKLSIFFYMTLLLLFIL